MKDNLILDKSFDFSLKVVETIYKRRIGNY